jgi:hypothetical protein
VSITSHPSDRSVCGRPHTFVAAQFVAADAIREEVHLRRQLRRGKVPQLEIGTVNALTNSGLFSVRCTLAPSGTCTSRPVGTSADASTYDACQLRSSATSRTLT